MIGGEIESPRAWMKNILTAMAVARILAGTHPKRTAFKGPVFRNRKNSAVKMAGRKIAGSRELSASTVIGAPANMHRPEIQRYECLVYRSRLSPRNPPANVPKNPETTVMAPKTSLALAVVMPLYRSRKAGIQPTRPPKAKV